MKKHLLWFGLLLILLIAGCSSKKQSSLPNLDYIDWPLPDPGITWNKNDGYVFLNGKVFEENYIYKDAEYTVYLYERPKSEKIFIQSYSKDVKQLGFKVSKKRVDGEKALLIKTGDNTREAILFYDYQDQMMLLVPHNMEFRLKNYMTGDIVTLGAYEQDNNKSNGPEPVEWIVINTDCGGQTCSLKLLSKYALDSQPYNKIDYENDWTHSSLSTWLDEDFSKSISITPDLLYFTLGSYGGTFRLLPFTSEIKLAEEFLQAEATKYAEAHGAFVDPERGTTIWWIADCGEFPAAYVDVDGLIYRTHRTGENYAVRPYISINLMLLDSIIPGIGK